MAFEAQQIYPIDFKKGVAIGIDIPFSVPGVFKSNYTTKEATRNNLINYFLTNPGERPLNPNFGAGLRSFVFQQIADDNLDFLEEEISSNLEKFFPNINIDNLLIGKQEDENTINVSLDYSIINTGITDNINLEFI